MKLSDLITNTDNRLSTTGTIQFLGFLAMTAVLVYSVYLDRTYVPELFSIFALFCGGLVATKGAVSALRERGKTDD